jgi:hypothetical protein
MERIGVFLFVTSALCTQGTSSSLRSDRALQTGSTPPPKVANIGGGLAGQDMLVFSNYDTLEKRGSIFEGAYARGLTPADGLLSIPDGYDMTQTTLCSSLVDTQQVSGQTSLKKSETTEVKVSVSAAYGPVKGEIQNSNRFTKLSEQMSSTDSYLQVSSLTCKLYQVGFKKFDPPGFTSNFVQGVVTINEGLVNGDDSAFLSEMFVNQFGTHYMERGSLGSIYMTTTVTSKAQQSLLESNGVSVEAGAKASFYGNAVGTSVLNSKEQAEASYFEQHSSTVDAISLGTMLPQGDSIQAVIADWQKKTATSNGLALVGGYQFQRIDELLAAPNALFQVNKALAKHNFTTALNATSLANVRQVITTAIENLCQRNFMQCDGPLADKPLPPPASVSVNAFPATYGGNGGGGGSFSESTQSIAGLFGRSALTSASRPTVIRTWWDSYTGHTILSGVQVEYTDSEGNIRPSLVRGGASGQMCEIIIAKDERVQRLEFRAGEQVDSIAAFTSKGPLKSGKFKCGTSGGGFRPRAILNGNDYFVGFSGKSGLIVDAITPLVATTVV